MPLLNFVGTVQTGINLPALSATLVLTEILDLQSATKIKDVLVI